MFPNRRWVDRKPLVSLVGERNKQFAGALAQWTGLPWLFVATRPGRLRYGLAAPFTRTWTALLSARHLFCFGYLGSKPALGRGVGTAGRAAPTPPRSPRPGRLCCQERGLSFGRLCPLYSAHEFAVPQNQTLWTLLIASLTASGWVDCRGPGIAAPRTLPRSICRFTAGSSTAAAVV